MRFLSARHLVLVGLVVLAGFAVLTIGRAAGQTKPEDLPPPPGALERELGLPGARVAAPSESGRDLIAAIEIPFTLEGGHIIIDAALDAGPPRPFMFDTGARNLITNDTAKALNVAVVSTARVAGIGPKVSFGGIVTVGRIAIGAIVLEQQKVIVTELPNVIADRGSRPRLAGLIGSELLARYAVTIDYVRRVLILNSPGFRPPSAGFALPLGYAISPDGLSHPSVRAELNGIAGEFSIDTGSGGQVFMSDQFQREHQPFADAGKTLRFRSPGGIGGRTNIRMGFGRGLSIGPATLTPPVITGSTDAGGARLAASAGLLGNVILSQFLVTIDYQSGQAYFASVAGRKLPSTLHGTGLILDKPDHEAFEVLDVLAGSAAERAGLRAGDRIVEVAGRAARDLGIADVQALNSSSHASVVIRTSDQRRFDLSIGQILP
jgi:hypothetical protein